MRWIPIKKKKKIDLWSSEKTSLCYKQSIKPVNEDDPELKNKLQTKPSKSWYHRTDIKARDDILKLDNNQENNGSGTVGSKCMDQEDN